MEIKKYMRENLLYSGYCLLSQTQREDLRKGKKKKETST